MKGGRRNIARTVSYPVLTPLALLACLAFVEGRAPAQKIDTATPKPSTPINKKEIEKLPSKLRDFDELLKLERESAQGDNPWEGSRSPSPTTSADYPPVRESLPGGGYRIIYRNERGEQIREEEYTSGGEVTRKTSILRIYPDGRDAVVVIESYGVTGVGSGTRMDTIYYNRKGDVIRTVTEDYDGDPNTPLTRKVTERGRTRIEQFNPQTGRYEEKTPTPATTAPSAPAAPAPPRDTTPAPTQTTTSDARYNPFEFYAGFSHNRVDVGDGREGFNGFAASFTGNVNRYVGLKGYYSFHTRSFEDNGFDFSSRASIHQLLGGVQFQDNALEDGPARPFAHLLAGVAHHRFGFDDGVGSFSDSRTGFAGVIGGGVDFRLNDRADFRVQFDYNPNRIEGEWQHNVRAGVGVVFNFGGRSEDDDADGGTDDRDPSVSAVPQDPDAKMCEWKRKNLGRDTNVTQVRSDRPRVVEVRPANLSESGGFEYHCLVSRGTALITYKYTAADGNEKEEKLRVFCNAP